MEQVNVVDSVTLNLDGYVIVIPIDKVKSLSLALNKLLGNTFIHTGNVDINEDKKEPVKDTIDNDKIDESLKYYLTYKNIYYPYINGISWINRVL